MSSSKQRLPQKQKPSFQINLLIWTSITLSLGVLVWAFTLPSRSRSSSHDKASSHTTSTATSLKESIIARQISAEQFRTEARLMDEEFMRMQRDRMRAYESRNLPGQREAEQYLEQHRKAVREKIEELKDAPPDSDDGLYRKSLIESLDAPQ